MSDPRLEMLRREALWALPQGVALARSGDAVRAGAQLAQAPGHKEVLRAFADAKLGGEDFGEHLRLVRLLGDAAFRAGVNGQEAGEDLEPLWEPDGGDPLAPRADRPVLWTCDLRYAMWAEHTGPFAEEWVLAEQAAGGSWQARSRHRDLEDARRALAARR